ncbi:MAG: hypothetical protein KJ070_15575 [Verrucomicrobia bacterium]|nr:hypothetical protein [Verrucomicrobiota bacterium]
MTGDSWNGANFDWVTIKYAAEVVRPPLNIQRLSSNAVLSCTNAALGLQSAPAISDTFTNVPGATSPYTIPIAGGQAFFRLSLSGGCSSGISGLLAHEPFDYPAGSALDTMNGGTGFSGPWSSTIAGPNYIIADGSLNFSPLCVSGGRMFSTPGQTQMARTLASDFGADGSTRYFSFLLRPEGVLNGGDFGGFHGLALQGGPGLFIGKPGGGALESYVLEDVGGAGQVPSSVTAVVGETVLLVVKAEFAVGNDTFTLYVNPVPGSPEPATGTGTVKSDLDLGTSNTLLIYSGGEFSLDELRFGETFESVTPR